MKKSILSLSVIALAVFVFASCKKEKDDSSYYYFVPGQWQLTQAGVDLNKNGILDSAEVSDAGAINNTVRFLSDFTGQGEIHFGYFDVSTGFNWGLSDYESTLWVAKGSDTAKMKIMANGINKMILLNNTVTVYGNNTWMVLERK